MCADLSTCPAYQRGRAAVKDNPAPEHVVTAINRALRAPRRGERGDDRAEASERRLVGQGQPLAR